MDPRGVPLAMQLSAANVHDSKLLEPLVDAVQPIRRPLGQSGRPRKRPMKLHADKGYDYAHLRRALRQRRITPRIARRGMDSSERLGRVRWVVEQAQAWVVTFRKLTARYDRHAAWEATGRGREVTDGSHMWSRPTTGQRWWCLLPTVRTGAISLEALMASSEPRGRVRRQTDIQLFRSSARPVDFAHGDAYSQVGLP